MSQSTKGRLRKSKRSLIGVLKEEREVGGEIFQEIIARNQNLYLEGLRKRTPFLETFQ